MNPFETNKVMTGLGGIYPFFDASSRSHITFMLQALRLIDEKIAGLQSEVDHLKTLRAGLKELVDKAEKE